MDRQVTIVGMGYVGLTMAAFLAERGAKVVGVDIDREKLNLLSEGKIPFYEPRLNNMIKKNLVSENLFFSDKYVKALEETSLTFITVGTPEKKNGSIDLEQILNASKSIGKVLRTKRDYHLIVVRSTVIPGTTENVVGKTISVNSKKICSKDFGLCMNPEFLREGSAVQDMINPDRIIIGESDKTAGQKLENFYTELYSEDKPKIFRTNLENSEMIKYANNTFLATKVSFINSLANLCEKIPGADIKVVAEGLGLDPRISPLFLKAGLGWGGSCFPKDLKALLAFAQTQKIHLPIISAAIEVNNNRPTLVIEKAKELLDGLKGKRISILGLAFKPNTNDVRESVSLKIINGFLKEGAIINAYDPVAIENARKILGEKITFTKSTKECLNEADCCILVTEWDEFKSLSPEDFKAYMKKPILIDGRRLYDPEDFIRKIEYFAIGLGK